MYTVFVISSTTLDGSDEDWCDVLYCPAGVNKRLPSGANVKRRKKEVSVSLWYRFAFLAKSV